MFYPLTLIATLVIGALILFSNYLVFMVVPNEAVMGAVQRIFYFHVGSAFACYCSVAVMLFGALWFLSSRNKKADALQLAAGEVGFAFCSIVLVSGMIWANSAWNIPFSWKEPRLVSFLCLWLIFLGFLLLRKFGAANNVAAHSAVFSILGALTVPVVVYSVKILSNVAQLHPVVVENRGLREPIFVFAFWFTNFALVVMQFVLVAVRYRLELLDIRIKFKEIDLQ